MSSLSNTLNTIWRWPLWVGGVFTGEKSFRDNPVIGSPLLNRMGLHCFRLVLAHGMTAFRRLLLSFLMPAAYRIDFMRDGYVVIENFLPAEDFETAKKSLQDVTGSIWECKQGNTVTHRFLFRPEDEDVATGLKLVTQNKFINQLFSWAGSGNRRPLPYFECIHSGVLDNLNEIGVPIRDPQLNLHADTFQPTVKGWLYLEDVTEDKGPFQYVPGSHKLTWGRLKWEYKKSLDAYKSDSYSRKGSFRAASRDLEEIGLPPRKPLVVKKNTLVVADTFGFHGRGHSKEGSIRRAFYFSDRGNPFLPLPGLNIKKIWEMKRQMVFSLLERDEKKKSPAWSRIPAAQWKKIDLVDL